MKFGTLVRINNPAEAKEEFENLIQMGFEACQLVYKPKEYTKEAAEIVKKAAEETGIDISAQFCSYYDSETIWDTYYGYETAGINVEAYRASRVDYVKKAAQFANWLGIEDIIIHAGYVPSDPFAPKYHTMVTAVKSISDYLKSMNMNLLFETGQEAPIVLLRLFEDVGNDNLFINLDPANIVTYGYGNPVDAVRIFGKYVRNMHGKDGKLPTRTRFGGDETPVGEGYVDFHTLLKLLKDVGYDRYIIIEREISGDQQIKDILHAKKYLEEIWYRKGH